MTEKLSYEQEVITRTITSTQIVSGVEFATVQADYGLSSSDFLRLKDDRNWMQSISVNGFFTIIGYFVSISPKLVSQVSGGPGAVDKNEWLVIVSGLIFCLVVWAASRVFPSERKKVMKDITEHFQTRPKVRQQVRGGK